MKNSRQISRRIVILNTQFIGKKSRKIRSNGEPFEVEQTLQALLCHHMQKMCPNIRERKRDVGGMDNKESQLAFKTDRRSSGRLCRTVSSCPCRCNRV